MKRHGVYERWEEREYMAEQADLWNAISRHIKEQAVAKQERPYRDLDTIDGSLLGPSVDTDREMQRDMDRLLERDGGW
mgnify:CR=1 FL=1